MSIYQEFLDTANAHGWSYDEAFQSFALAAVIFGAAIVLISQLLIRLFRLLKVHFQPPLNAPNPPPAARD